MLEVVPWIAAMTVAGIATITDLRHGKVYNWLTAPALAAGVALHSATSGVSGVVLAIEGVLMAVGLLLGMAVLGTLLGGGDAKLLMALGALLGPMALLQSFAAGAIVGGLAAVATAAWHKRLGVELASLCRSVAARLWGGMRFDVRSSHSLRLPYAAALSAGVAIAWLWNGGGTMLW